jgi:hypothetical protein
VTRTETSQNHRVTNLPDLWTIAYEDERRLIGGCLLYPTLLPHCGIMTPTDFTNSECRAIWLTMAKLQEQGDSWDYSSVASELAKRGLAETELVIARLTEGVVPSASTIGRAAARVREMSLRCRIVKEVEALQKTLLNPAIDLNPSLQTVRRVVESFVNESERIDLGVSLDGLDEGMSTAGPQILDEIAAFIRRFVILSNSEILVISLWIAHTWALEAADTTPYLAITSAVMRSGKTRLLEILELLVRSPWLTGRVTAAALYRRVENDCPTLLLDEWDAMTRNPDLTEALRGILNSGHGRDGKVSVCGPKSSGYQPTDFRVFCPKVIAGIGTVPETIADRSIPIRLKRKASGENVERFRKKLVLADANSLKARLMCWVRTHLEELKVAKPQLPECLSDRQQDGAEPLLAIADAVGGDWPPLARAALKELCSTKNAADESIGVNLLADIRHIFSEKNAEELSSKELVCSLSTLDGTPWPALDRSGPITANVLARLLAPFDIFPRDIRIGTSVLKGYKREGFGDAWNRYLNPVTPSIPLLANATPLQPAKKEADKKPVKPDVAPAKTLSEPRLEGVVAL